MVSHRRSSRVCISYRHQEVCAPMIRDRALTVYSKVDFRCGFALSAPPCLRQAQRNKNPCHINDYIFKNPNGMPYRPDVLHEVLSAPWLVMDSSKCAILARMFFYSYFLQRCQHIFTCFKTQNLCGLKTMKNEDEQKHVLLLVLFTV